MSDAISLPKNRLVSVDAYRGLVMFLMLAEVLQLRKVAEALPESRIWKLLAWHQTHVEWVGCTLHDLIQPSFSMLVGLVLPFSLANRESRGESGKGLVWHALGRALLLIGLGIFLRSLGQSQTNFTFVDTLTQIGLGYFWLFLLARTNWKWQLAAFVAIVGGYWGWFAMKPLPAADFDWTSVGVSPEWREKYGLTGFSAHWNKNIHPAATFEVWWMNLFPRSQPYTLGSGGYVTLSFLPTLATMLIGLLAGDWLKSSTSQGKKLLGLILSSVLCLGIAFAAQKYDVCPIVKRIWTPAWVLYSGGWCLAILSAFYLVVEIGGWSRWAFPLIVIGSNSIAAYCSSWMIKAPIREALVRHFGEKPFLVAGEAYQPLLLGGATLGVIWLILWWMYRRKIFIRM